MSLKRLFLHLSCLMLVILYFDLNGQSFKNGKSLLRHPISKGAWLKPTLLDIDDDNDLDLFFGNGAGELILYHNTRKEVHSANRQFENFPTIYDAFSIGNYSAPALADLDNDGDLDMISGKEDGLFKYWRNDGSSSSPVFSELSGSANPFYQFDVGERSSPAFIDIDADGDLDMVSGSGDGNFFYYKNIDTISQPDFVLQTGSDNPFESLHEGAHGEPGYQGITFTAPSFVDIDDDGDFDLVSGNKYGSLIYFENIGTSDIPSFALRDGSDDPFDQIILGSKLPGFGSSYPGNYTSPFFIDYDGDIDLDIVVGSSDGVLGYIENEGTNNTPIYVLKTRLDNPFRGFDLEENASNIGEEADVGLVDMDGDGDLDLVAFIDPFNNPIIFHCFENIGSSNNFEFKPIASSDSPFANISSLLQDSGLDTDYLEPTYADIDNDGDIDLICGEGGGRIAFFENQGTSQQADFVYITAFNPFSSIDIGEYSDPTFGDIDNDGDLDLVFKGGVYYRNDGTPEIASFIEISGTSTEYPFGDILDVVQGMEVSIGDVNSDGWVDIILAGSFVGGATSSGGGRLELWLNNGQFGNSQSFNRITDIFPFSCGYAGCTTWDYGVGSDVGLGDIDGDGDIDMIISRHRSYLDIVSIENTTPLPSPELIINEEESTLSVTDKYANYQWYRNETIIEGETTHTLYIDNAGSYYVAVQDGETQSNTVVIEPIEITEITTVGVSCEGVQDGAVRVFASGGYGSLSFSSDGANFQAGNHLVQLSQGTHDITVRSVFTGYSISQNAEILEEEAIDNYSKSFETHEAIKLLNSDGSYTWRLTTAGQYDGNSSLYMNFYNYEAVGEEDYYLLSKPISSSKSMLLSFAYAYTKYASDLTANDSLAVIQSFDCGATWEVLDQIGGDEMMTAEPTNDAFIPSGKDQWAVRSVQITPSEDKYLLAFKTINDYGNILFLDSITLAPENQVPSLTNLNFSIAEHSPDGTLIGILTATDPENDALTYSILFGNTNDAFSLDANTGALIVQNQSALDFKSTSMFELTVEVNDGHGGVATAVITITINNPDDVLGLDSDVNQFYVYPNPVLDELIIRWNYFNHGTLFELSGRKIRSITHRITSLTDLKRGVYLLSLYGTNGETFSVRIQKK